MADINQCLKGLLFLLAACLIFGQAVDQIVQMHCTGAEKFLTGFFVYYGAFQLAALPVILKKGKLSTVEMIWEWCLAAVLVFTLVLTVVFWIRKRKRARQQCELAQHEIEKPIQDQSQMEDKIQEQIQQIQQPEETEPKEIKKRIPFVLQRCLDFVFLISTIVLTGGQVWFAAVQKYLGWDTLYYVGIMNDAVKTDHMYLTDGDTGLATAKLNLRYALSAFYMHTTVLCRKLSVDPLLVQKYVIGTLCVILTNVAIYLIGKSYWDKIWKACFFTNVVIVLTFFFQTLYTNAQFLLYRAYEAKAFCANVQIFALLYGMRLLWRDCKSRKTWIYLFVVCAASVPVSMSSLVIVPAMAGIFFGVHLLVYRQWSVIWKGALCILPNVGYLLVYLASVKGWLEIGV